MLKTQWYQGRGRRPDRQRGAVLVEAGFVFPLLMLVVFAVIELGGLLSTYSSTANAVRAGGRMASVQGANATSDQQTLARMAEEASAVGDGEIRYIIIWEASGPDATVPPACLGIADSLGSANTSSQGVNGVCNVYALPQASGGAFDMATGQASNSDPMFYFGCQGAGDPLAGQKVDCRWAPQDRETRISPRGTPSATAIRPDYVGVYMRVEYDYLTGFFGNVRTITDSSITLLEPDSFGVTP